MSLLNISLFGGFQVICEDQIVDNLETQKVQELFCYLLLNRKKPQPREMLAGLLWGDSTTAQSKRYLRQALWQLHTALDSHVEDLGRQVLCADTNFIFLNPQSDLWVDVAVFEQNFALVKGLAAQEMNDQQFRSLQAGVELYQGNLLEGWYQDWCLFERERLQNMYIAMLDKLMDYCEIHQQYENGIAYGTSILRYDRAREHTHLGLMRLLYLSGDRTGALRQYDRCAAALEEELSVKPSKSTRLLYEQILVEKVREGTLAPEKAAQVQPFNPMPLPATLGYLRRFQALLEDFQRQLQHEIQVIEHDLTKR